MKPARVARPGGDGENDGGEAIEGAYTHYRRYPWDGEGYGGRKEGGRVKSRLESIIRRP
jgi:hypothetical protein